MTAFLYSVVYFISKIHTFILELNDAYEYQFTDKELHFLVIGLFGIILIIGIYPIIKMLADGGHIMTITAIYVFTIIIVITFAIEIGQKITNTGTMSFGDILYGVTGFVVMYLAFVIVIGILKLIARLFRREKNEND